MPSDNSIDVIFRCDLGIPGEDFPHFWEHTVGSGHATLALRADWQAQMRRAHDELGFRHVRFHGLLDDDMGTLIDQDDQPLYSFFNADQIFDFLLSIGMRPFVELSFMPTMLSSSGQIIFHDRANVSEPKDYDQWAVLISKLVGHWVDRYGADEVRQWFFEVWNEPNLEAFGSSKQQDYFKLYAYTPRHPIRSETLHIELLNAPQPAIATIRRVDVGNANAKALWVTMGRPDYLNPAMVNQLHAASAMPQQQQPVTWRDHTLEFDVTIPPLGVAAIRLEFASFD